MSEGRFILNLLNIIFAVAAQPHALPHSLLFFLFSFFPSPFFHNLALPFCPQVA
jgi:hypothetical protein